MSKKNLYLSLILLVVLSFVFVGNALAEEVVVCGWAGNWDLWFGDWAKAFKNETGIEIKYMSGPGVQMYQKILSEKNNPKVDVFINVPSLNYLLASKGLLEDIPWDKMSSSKNIDDKFKSKNVAIWGYDLFLLAYNRDYIQEKDAPKKWVDLIDTKYRGKITLNEPNAETALRHWMVMKDKYGEDKAWQYLMDMYKNVAKTTNTPGDVERSVATGEAPIAAMSMGNLMVAVQQAGGNIQSVPPEDGSWLMLNSIVIIKNCPHKDAAVKFVNWYLSEYAQNDIMNNLGISIAVNNNVKLTNESIKKIGLAGHTVDEVMAAAYVPDWLYWTEKVEGEKTRLELTIDELEERVKGLKD